MDAIQLTPNQRRVLDLIQACLERDGHAPTLREISETLGLSSHSSAQDYVEALVRTRSFRRAPRRRR